jgi:hypothetical protein
VEGIAVEKNIHHSPRGCMWRNILVLRRIGEDLPKLELFGIDKDMSSPQNGARKSADHHAPSNASLLNMLSASYDKRSYAQCFWNR